MRRRLLSGFLAALCLFALLDASTAGAGYDPVASGQTRLVLARGFATLLKANGISLRGVGGVSVKGSVAVFPVAGGKVEPVEAKGVVEHRGSLVFQAGTRALPLKALQLKTTRRSAPYAAKLGGGQLKLATTRAFKDERVGFGSTFGAPDLLLSANAATRLDKKLGLPGVFVAGMPLGTMATTANPASVGIAPAGKAELTIDPAFAAKLAGLFVAVNPVFPTEHPGAFDFPIGGGTLALAPGVPASGLKTNGALEFIQVGGGQVFARELELDLTDSVANGEWQLVLSGAAPGPNQGGAVFGLGASSLAAEPTARTIAVTGLPVTLEAGTAQAFDEAFCRPIKKPDAFAAGETLGTVSFTAKAE